MRNLLGGERNTMVERKDIQFSNDQVNEISEWIQKKAPDLVCPVCGQDHFTIDNNLSVGIIHGEKVIIGGTIIPKIEVYCNNCFSIQYFLAIPILGMEEITSLIEGPKHD